MTWNPVTGCDRLSPGCAHCYALTFAERWRGLAGHPYEQGFDLKLWPERLEVPHRWRKPRLVFVNSMSDLFHPEVPLDFIRRVFKVIEETPQHTYQVLTKRSKRLAEIADDVLWPKNLWMGVSVESDRYTFRIDHLRCVGAAVRFVSAEPLLGGLSDLDLSCIDWLIAGGESGPNARPVQLGWVRDLRDQCCAAGIAFFFKQWGGRTPKAGGRELDGHTWDDLPNGTRAVHTLRARVSNTKG